MENQKGKVSFKPGTSKVSFSLIYKATCKYSDMEGGDSTIEVKIEKVNDKVNCIRFQKVQGDKLTFLDLFNELKDDLIERDIILRIE